MNKSKKPKSANPSRAFPLLLGVLLACLAPAAGAFELRDIQLAPGPGQATMKLSFSGGADGEYPLYFQKVDPSRGTLTLSFLDTETSFPLGRHAVAPEGPLVEEILLKRITSPSGKNFLGIEVRLKEPPAGEAPVQPQPKGTLKVILGKAEAGTKGRPGKPWSLAKSLKSGDDYLNAKAAPPPAQPAPEVPNKVQAHPPEAPEAAAPAPKASEPASQAPSPAEAPAVPETAAPGGAPATLKEIRMAVTRSQEDLTLVFDPPGSTPVHTVQAAPGDSTALELTLDGVASGLARKEYALPGSGLFKRVRTAQRNGNLVLLFQLASNDPVHLLPREGALTLTGGGKGEAALPFKWSSLKPDAAPPQPSAAVPVVSAHQEGAAVDAAAAGTAGKQSKGKGLSSSRTFSLGKGGKSMILLKDSAALKSAPGPKAKTQRKIPIGEKVERIDREGAWIKVVSGMDTGYVRASEAAYEDEMTEAQLARHRQNMEAAAARAEAERKRAEKLAASEAEAAAKAAAALRKTESKAEAPKAEVEAAAVAAAEAEPVRVAGPGAAPSASPVPDAAPGRRAADGPKLSLAETPELADKLAEEKKAAEGEKMRVQPGDNRVAYNSYGRRDPFIPVEQGMADNGIDIDQMKVVGIIWQAQEPMAVLEHSKESGVSFTVKQGDPVHNGRVSRITRDQVTFDISEYGISRSYSLKLVSNKEGKKQ